VKRLMMMKRQERQMEVLEHGEKKQDRGSP
jgi:hypothetical protein